MQLSLLTVILILLFSCTTINNQYINAVYENNLYKIIKLIEKGADVNNKIDGCPYTYIAAKAGRLDILKTLVNFGADISQATDHGLQPLWIAARAGHVDIVEYLLELGVNVDNCINKEYGTALLAVSAIDLLDEGTTYIDEQDILDIISMLIEHGANVNAADESGWTPIMMFSQYEFINLLSPVKLLHENGADLNVKNNYGMTPLMISIMKRGTEPISDYFIKSGANLEIKNNYGQSALHRACYAGKIDMVEKLLSKGVDIDVQTNKGSTPLMVAVKNENYKIVELLLENGADPNVQTFEISLVNNADPDDVQTIDSKFTALMLAALGNNKYIVRLLIENGADIMIKDANGKTAYDIAKKAHNKKIINILSQ